MHLLPGGLLGIGQQAVDRLLGFSGVEGIVLRLDVDRSFGLLFNSFLNALAEPAAFGNQEGKTLFGIRMDVNGRSGNAAIRLI